jgi:hypothetical protein
VGGGGGGGFYIYFRCMMCKLVTHACCMDFLTTFAMQRVHVHGARR